MIYVIIGTGLFFVFIGLILTESNARYLLAGYNTMSEEERSKFDIRSYLVLFRKFHLFLGISFIVFSLLIFYKSTEMYLVLFMAGYPVLLYVYLLIKGNSFKKRGGQSES